MRWKQNYIPDKGERSLRIFYHLESSFKNRTTHFSTKYESVFFNVFIPQTARWQHWTLIYSFTFTFAFNVIPCNIFGIPGHKSYFPLKFLKYLFPTLMFHFWQASKYDRDLKQLTFTLIVQCIHLDHSQRKSSRLKSQHHFLSWCLAIHTFLEELWSYAFLKCKKALMAFIIYSDLYFFNVQKINHIYSQKQDFQIEGNAGSKNGGVTSQTWGIRRYRRKGTVMSHVAGCRRRDMGQFQFKELVRNKL